MTYVNSIKVGDVNGDEKKEVIAGAMYLMALNETGSLIWKRGYEEYDFIPDYTDYNTVSLGDLDNDGVLDIVIGTGSSKHLKAYYGNGSIMWRRNDTKYPIRSTDIYDIDGDGRNEVLAVQNFYNS